jgi:tRNA A-37 threonylcarbamoyl transferase component Bud32
MKKTTQGMSGCSIGITAEQNIIKISAGESYNQRLLAQSKKQQLFSKMSFRNIYIPKVIKQGSINNLFFFEMEYASGLNAVDYINQAGKKELDFICETIFLYFDQIKEHSIKFDAKKIILKKIKELISRKNKHNDFLNFILNLVENENKIYVPKTICHGDLTFGNIIFDKSKIFLIDFLDSYLDTFFCDLAKLKQDLYYFWLPLLLDSDLRSFQSMNFIWEKIEKNFEEVKTTQFIIIDAINILRIEPYITSPKQYEIFELALRKNPLYEDFNDSNGRKIF